MTFKDSRALRQCLGLLATAILLALCLVLLSSQQASANSKTSYDPPPTDPRTPALAGPSARPQLVATSPVHPQGAEAWDSQWVGAPVVLLDDGELRMWYLGFDSSGISRVGLATSPDGTNWTKSASNPLLTGSEPEVLKEGPGDYKMWLGQGDTDIYRATSADGLNWTVDPLPALPATFQDDTFDRDSVGDPSIVKDGSGTYWMFYNGYNADWNLWQIGVVTSTNGIDWTRGHPEPVLLPGSPGDWDQNDTLDPVVVLDGGTFQMWYSAFDDTGTRRIGYATSPDGVHWTKDASNPVFEGEAGQWDEGNVGNMFVSHDDDYDMWYASNGQIGYITSTNGIDWTRSLTGPVLSPGPRLYIEVNYGHNWVGGQTLPGATVAITVAGKGVATGAAGPDGWFWTGDFAWDPDQPALEPGDVVTATAAGLETTVDPVGQIDGLANSQKDVVTGTLQVPWFTTVDVACEVWVQDGPSIVITDVIGTDGSFLCDFGDIGWDLQPAGPSVMVRYWEPDGDMVINEARFLDLLMSVNYGHDWVEGNYEPGHTLWLTVTDDVGSVKATAELPTQVIDWWGGRTGFSTNAAEYWVPQRPDIEVGDYVYGRMDNGFAATVRIGSISGQLDVDADTVSGNVSADWLSGTLNGNCGVWMEGGPGQEIQIDLDTGGAYSCDFSTMDPPWDLLPGQDVGVQYQEPDGDWVINVFREPSPDMRVEKWREGGGEVSPGGPVVYTIRYSNDGDAVAETVRLTDTLPSGTFYVADTSDFPATEDGDQIVWSFGPVNPGEQAQFQIVLTNTASLSDTLVNVVDISTDFDGNQDNNHAEADVHVGEGQPDLYVNKNPIPGDPATGQTMLWEINYGNNGPVASGPVALTDTLPQDTSIVAWSSENGYALWSDHSTAGELILQAPTIPANWGDRILLRLLVGATSGTQLTNTVEIATENDANLEDNWQRRDDVWVGDPRWDAYVDKSFNWAQLVPGGQIEYGIYVRNHGNMATQVWLTDTLPAGTTFAEAWDCEGPTCIPFPPDQVSSQNVVWDMGVMEPGQWQNLNVRVDVDSDTTPGTTLNNCVTAGIVERDWSPYDNQDCVEDTVYAYGPNLRITKRYQWNGEGQLEYTIEFRNVGTSTLNDVVINDTLPANTTFNGNQWNWFWEGIEFNQDGNQLSWTISRLDPTWSSGLSYQADLDGGIVGQQGLCFTNAAEAPIPGDIFPADNSAEVTACTGPDVYVEKWLSGGEPRPGAIVTFTVEFGNLSKWPWNGDENAGSHITETLPAATTFITATAPWNPADVWHPESIDGNVVVWGWGPMWADNRWRFDVVAQISDTAQGGDILTNSVEAHGDNPGDIEPNENNNAFDLPVTVVAPVFTVAKVYNSSKVAGTPVTYTLTATNLGNAPGTNVLLGDKVPAGLTYSGSNGTLVGNSVNWTLSSIAAEGGTGTGWFSGVLGCAGTVTNDTYRVISSDQGVDSQDGSSVSFAILAPTLSPSFDQSATQVDIGEAVDFADTSTTNGGAIVTWGWDFGDGHTASGAAVSHAYDAPGSYDVTLTITDTCGYDKSTTVSQAVTIAQYRVFLPTVVRH